MEVLQSVHQDPPAAYAGETAIHSQPRIVPIPGSIRADGDIEWPTLIVAAACYAAYLLATYFAAHTGVWLAILIMALVLAQHSSLQHEVLHGHPFRTQSLNELLVFPAIGLFLPYQRFRDTHLAHHTDTSLTDPYDDPESNFLDPAMWQRLPAPAKAALVFNNTLAGRMLIGPLISLVDFYIKDLRGLSKGHASLWRAYSLHGLGLVVVAAWQMSYSTLPVWAYIVAAYLGISLLKIRTFLEHRAHEVVPGRTVVIEDRGPLSLLFLNNNYHAVHHAYPAIPWYQLPDTFKVWRAEFVQRNCGYYYRSYGEVFRRYFFTPKDCVPHPLWPPIDRARPGGNVATGAKRES